MMTLTNPTELVGKIVTCKNFPGKDKPKFAEVIREYLIEDGTVLMFSVRFDDQSVHEVRADETYSARRK